MDDTLPDLGPVGTDLTVRDDGSHLDHAAELEELGYGALWIAGGQIDALDRLAEVVRATRRIPVVPSIIPTGRYPADEVAALYRELEAEHPGRLVAGLGAPQQPRAMAAFGAYLDRLDSVGTRVPAGRRMLAAIGPRKLALARDRAAGALPLMVTPEYTAGARGILGPDRVLAVQQFTVLDDDPVRARETARPTLGFLLGVRGYRDNVLRMGFTDDDVATISDRLVDAVVVHGGPDDVAARVAAHRAAGADHVSVGTLGPTGGVAAARRLAPALPGVRAATRGTTVE
ncbi:TIGR03620 family F420-dependent LLM class oxidoreductase [Pseudonocardia endophytica]|uniref:Putative F420-dependent oxidoreductase n=1 Tax=Pseudonocardia endophytica TaxID=401976 RepID=A0A4R1HLT8_PSEEN|nr:TIGR03620 family F420-dependent LLM class oxidoreductase [Pseudonocardia endophytica]TCK20599.1 putative F420-dependent oxidoreductase [Pseudonocardia endophytica]